MLFDRPINFEEALARREVRAILPNNLSSAELSQLSVHIRERSLALARVSNADFLQYVKTITDDVVQGRETVEVGVRKLANFADSLGDEELSSSMSRARLILALRTQVEMAYGYAQWRQGQVQSVLDKYPAQEFYRAFDRKEPRDWPTRWDDSGGDFYEGQGSYPQGRMIAVKNSALWVALSVFGNPYPPFDFNSGMMVRDVSREEALRLGVIQEHQRVMPQARDFERDSRSTITILSPELERVLVESLGEGWAIQDGVLYKANQSANQFNSLKHPRDEHGRWTESFGADAPQPSSERGWTPEDRKKITAEHIRHAAKWIGDLPESKRDDMHYGGPVLMPARCLYEAQQIAPKDTGENFKRVTERNSFKLNQEASYVANVEGVHFGLNKEEDPDEPDDDSKFVWAYQRLDDGGGKYVVTSTGEKSEAYREMKASLSKNLANENRIQQIRNSMLMANILN